MWLEIHGQTPFEYYCFWPSVNNNLWHFSTDFIFGGKSQMQYEKKLRIIFSSNCDLTLIHSFFCFWKKIIHTFIHSIFKLGAKIILAKHVNLHKKKSIIIFFIFQINDEEHFLYQGFIPKVCAIKFFVMILYNYFS